MSMNWQCSRTAFTATCSFYTANCALNKEQTSSRNRLGEITAAKQRVAYKPLLPYTFKRSRACSFEAEGSPPRLSCAESADSRYHRTPVANRVIRLITRQPRFRTWPMSKTNVNCHKRPEINYIRNLLNSHVFPPPPPHSDM